MSKRSDLVYLGTVLDAAKRAQAKVAGVTRQHFEADDTLQLALTYLVQNVGEAASKVPANLRVAHPEIEWEAIAGMRHRIVHDYWKVDFGKVWEVLQNDIPALIAELEKFTPPEPPAV